MSSLPVAAFELLAPHLTKVNFAGGSVLQEPGQPVRAAYFVQSGLVSLLSPLPEGPAIDTCSIGREGAVGLRAALGDHQPVTRAVVQIPITAAQISIPDLADAASRSASVRDMIIRYTDRVMEQTVPLVACATVHQVEQRLCRWLSQAHHRTGGTSFPITQECLAGMLGVRRTTVSTVGRTLQAEGIIKVRRGRIDILKTHALEDRACKCGCVGLTDESSKVPDLRVSHNPAPISGADLGV